MMRDFSSILDVLAERGAQAETVARIVCRLVLDGAELGELERVSYCALTSRDLISFRRPPREWFDRLLTAVNRGAIGRMSEDRIGARILTPPKVAAL